MSKPIEFKSQYKDLLNALVDMQNSLMYRTRRKELEQAEQLIYDQEQKIIRLEIDQGTLIEKLEVVSGNYALLFVQNNKLMTDFAALEKVHDETVENHREYIRLTT